jgi:Na+-translocating ferredoxin:NAD+ oxidoreductase subunit B
LNSESTEALTQALHALLPQTQCQRCGFPDCYSYAQAMAQGKAQTNQCPPGGLQGAQRLAQQLQRPVSALNPDYGVEGPRQLAVIDEGNCIGCTLCLDACPVDSILGGPKQMHTVIKAQCTGCALCLPPCPVDCITMVPTSAHTGWQAWSQAQADTALERYTFHTFRLARRLAEHTERLAANTLDKPMQTDTRSKQAVIAAAVAKARQRN